jgi:hypothetical protein
MNPEHPVSAGYTLANMMNPLKLDSIFSFAAYARESIDKNKRYISPLSHNSFRDHINRGVDTINNQLKSQQQLYKNRFVIWSSWLSMKRGGSNVTSMKFEYIDEKSGDGENERDVADHDIPIELEVEID